MITPNIKQLSKHFHNAKEIKCLDLGISVNINHVENFTFDKLKERYYVSGGIICVWNNIDGYATITKNKCNTPNCKKCNCR
ncbi:hypothetical protein [Flavobacterium sp.]|uniref:hypothetical protein n=1 Tax=Flavobacterium sp. TaxID=239 RepID=UPI0037530F46